jgi:peptidyl-prolyl cis-trans isomerase SurA
VYNKSLMHLRYILLPAAVLCCFTACRKPAPANVAATVNNRPITYAEVTRIYESQLSSSTGASEDLSQIQKLEVLRSLIENEIMLQRAEKLGLMATESEVDAKFNELKTPYTPEEFQRQLERRKMTAADLKTQLKRDLSVQKLINKEITSKISITEAEIANFYGANKASFNRAEPGVHLSQILVTAAPDPNVRNLKNDKAQNDEQAQKKIQALLARIRQGEDFAMLAENYSEDPNSAPSGGDLGLVPVSAFDGSSPDVRKLIGAMQPGQVSPIIPSQQAYRILKMISREPAGQRDLNDPRVQQTIREGLLSRKDQLLRNAYYETARNDATVVNYLAKSILATKAK